MRKIKSTKEVPYKKSPTRGPICENVQAATAQFNIGNPGLGGKYEMILVAANRTYDLLHGEKSTLEGEHKPTVTALLEIEQGLVSWDYVPKRGITKKL